MSQTVTPEKVANQGPPPQQEGFSSNASSAGSSLEGNPAGSNQRFFFKARLRSEAAFSLVTLLGLVLGGLLISFAWSENPRQNLCLAFEDNFDSIEGGLDESNWEYEVQTSGFGNNEFSLTSKSIKNTFVDNGVLYIVPTLTSDLIGEDNVTGNYTLSLNDTCTAEPMIQPACESIANATTGQMIRPAMTGRVRTRASIQYGRVEVRARLPTGDWLWPAIWMMPENSTYGDWPRSGEIDIMESKGNTVTSNKDRFYNSIVSTLHWGPTTYTDRWGMTTSNFSVPRDYYNGDFHTFGLDWSPDSLVTWIDKPSRRVLKVDLNRDMYKWSGLSSILWNGTGVSNPWSKRKGAPFDQAFYLILNVAVGGTNGYFSDSIRGKPWQNAGNAPMADFWAARDRWYPTWPVDHKKRGMAVESVKMWRRC